MAIDLRLAEIESDAAGRWQWKPGTDRTLIRVGGRWDRRRKTWGGKAAHVVPMRLHRGQERAARWFVDWMRRWVAGDWAGIVRVWSALLIGGRRSGKTHLACVVLVLFAVLKPKALIWAISPTLETGDELDEALKTFMPHAWYVRKQAKTGRSTTYHLANGSRIILRSGMRAERLRAGRVDMALLNESQEQSLTAYVKIRAPIADRGGLVILTANPPDRPSGRWVEDHFNRASAGEIDSIAFELDPRANPTINYDALTSMESEVDEKTYARDVLGLFPPIGDVVMHAWVDRENWIDPPARLVDVTATVTKRVLGRAFGYVLGCDFQRSPAQVAVVGKLLIDPDHPSEEILWIVDEIYEDHADENDLLDALESRPRWQPTGRVDGDCYRGWALPTDPTPIHCGAVIDASAWWQDGAHTKGRTSDRVFAARKWIHIYRPQPNQPDGTPTRVNPDVLERMKAGNALLRSASGRRRLFVARHCVRTAESFRRLEITHGRPNRRSEYAHGVDAVTYVVYRFFGVPKLAATNAAYTSVQSFDRGSLVRGVL